MIAIPSNYLSFGGIATVAISDRMANHGTIKEHGCLTDRSGRPIRYGRTAPQGSRTLRPKMDRFGSRPRKAIAYPHRLGRTFLIDLGVDFNQIQLLGQFVPPAFQSPE